MPIYNYTARDANGKIVRGGQEAISESVALSILQSKGLYVTEITSSVVEMKAGQRGGRRRHRRVKSDDLLFFIQQSGHLLGAGIAFVRTLELIGDQIDSQRLYDVIQELVRNIRAGSSFKDALARHPGIFPEYWLYLIEAGELSGMLPQVLAQIAKNLEGQQRLKTKILSALVYPIALISSSVLTVLAFMIFIIPTFEKIFKQFNSQLPPLTGFILAVSNFLRSYVIFVAVALVILFYFLRAYSKTSPGKRMLHRFMMNVPIFGNVVRDVIHARICLIFAMLLRSGLNFLKTIEITASVSGNIFFEAALNNVRLEVQQGKPFSASLKAEPLFASMLVNLATVGEESGKLPDMIDKAAEYYEARTEVFATRIGVLIEPMVMLFVGGIVGVIVVAMFMPILNLSKVIR